MTTYFPITEAMTDIDRFIPSELAKAWWKNPIAIGEADSTVPLNLLPTVFLGSANTPSGTSVTLSGLTLTPYKTLKVFLNGVSAGRGGSGSDLQFFIGGQFFFSENINTKALYGMIEVDLFDGVYAPAIGMNAFSGISASLTTAATSLTISMGPAIGAFTGGSFRVYGCK